MSTRFSHFLSAKSLYGLVLYLPRKQKPKCEKDLIENSENPTMFYALVITFSIFLSIYMHGCIWIEFKNKTIYFLILDYTYSLINNLFFYELKKKDLFFIKKNLNAIQVHSVA